MKNRYGVEYSWSKVSDNVYKFEMENLEHLRFGGLPYQEGIDFQNLGFFDPPGGPFIELGLTIEDRTITRIRYEEGEIFLEVE